MRYIEHFIENNKNKSFITNLNKYFDLCYYGRCKVISSFLTHLFIDAEHLTNEDNIVINKKYQEELVSILNEMIFYKIDNFTTWINTIIGGDNG